MDKGQAGALAPRGAHHLYYATFTCRRYAYLCVRYESCAGQTEHKFDL